MMDELTSIRELLRAPGPSERTTTRARAMLTAEVAASAAPQLAPRTAAPVRTPRRRRWVTAVAGGLALTGLAAAAVGIPALRDGSGHASGGAPPGAAARPGTAHDLLLAAAERAAQEPAATGRYWLVRSVGVAGPIRITSPAGAYDLSQRAVGEEWIPRDPGDAFRTGRLELGARPATDADRAVWEADNRPTTWQVQSDTVDGSPIRYSAAPGTPELALRDGPDRTVIHLGDGGLDLAGVRALPTEPAALRAAIAAHLTGADDGTLFRSLCMLLADAPAPPAVRAAAFRAIAGMDGVRDLGPTGDASGRVGTGVELARGFGEVSDRSRLIIDPESFQVLGTEYAATLTATGKVIKGGTSVVLSAGWTDREPSPPTAP